MTNHILLLKPESPIWHLPNKTTLRTYLYMLGMCGSDVSVLNKIVNASVKQVDVEYLIEAGYIVKERGRYILGANGEDDESVYLYANELNPLTEEAEQIKRDLQAYQKRFSKKTVVVEAGISLHNLLSNPKKITGVQHVIDAWKWYYALIYNREPRGMMKKEVGQFMHLNRMYGSVNSVKMVMMYLAEAAVPTVGELLLKKDKYYHRFTSRIEDADKAIKSSTDDGRGFFSEG